MTCPICESPDTACVHDTGPVAFNRCSDCELIYRDPMPSQEELDHFYQHEYRQEPPDSPRMANYFRAQADHRIAILTSRGTRTAEDEWVPALPQYGRVCDIGAGDGTFVEALAEKGGGDRWYTVGVEANPDYAAHSSRVGVGDIETWDWPTYPNGARTPDDDPFFGSRHPKHLYTIFHVLEHLRDPVSVLAKIRGWLAPEGRLWLEVPDMDHPLKGDVQREYIYPHLWGFNGQNILVVLSMAGWVCTDLFRKESDYTGRTSLHVIARVP